MVVTLDTTQTVEFVWFAPVKKPGVKEIQVDKILMVPVQGDGHLARTDLLTWGWCF